jgi:RHS repeat-associated protein
VSQSNSLRSRSLQKKSVCRSITFSSIVSGLESCHLESCVSYPNTTYRYTAFGGKASETYTAGTQGERNRYRFSTKYLDNEVETTEGTYYYRYRSYAVAMGRWLSRDPIGEDGGVNLYGMVGNSSVGSTDVLGLQECEHGQIKDPGCIQAAELQYSIAVTTANNNYANAIKNAELTYENDVNNARVSRDTEGEAVNAAYLACGFACAWTGPGIPACLAACTAAAVSGHAAVRLNYRRALTHAKNNLNITKKQSMNTRNTEIKNAAFAMKVAKAARPCRKVPLS